MRVRERGTKSVWRNNYDIILAGSTLEGGDSAQSTTKDESCQQQKYANS